MTIFKHYLNRYVESQEEEYTLQDYLEICRNDASAYATAAERMLMAIGEPELVDTRKDPRLSRLFSNKVLKIYPAFKEFGRTSGKAKNKKQRKVKGTSKNSFFHHFDGCKLLIFISTNIKISNETKSYNGD